MPVSTRTRLWILDLSYAVCVGLLIFSGILMTRGFFQVQESQRWVQHTNEVLIELNQTFSSLKDVQSAYRNLIITHDVQFETNYRLAKDELSTHFNRARGLTLDNPVQLRNAADLDELIRERLSAFEKNKTSSKPLSIQLVQNQFVRGDAVALTDDIKSHIDLMIQEEQRLLRERAVSNDVVERQFIVTLITTGILIFLALSFGFFNVRRAQLSAILEANVKSKEAWKKSIIADVARLVTGEIAPEVAAQHVLSYISNRLQICAGCFYMYRENSLHLISSLNVAQALAERGIGLVEDHAIPERISLSNPHSSVVAEAFKGATPTELRDIPDNYLRVSSSLGAAKPRSLIFLPVPFLGKNVGIFELASFAPMTPDAMNLFQQMAESIGAGMNSATSRMRLQDLLEETQRQSEELQTQQEELRTTNEELEQQARALESQQKNLNARNRDLDLAMQDSRAKALDLEKVNQYKSEFLAKMSHELRTPLNSLLILSSLLVENKEGNLSGQQKEFVQTIQNAGHDLLNLINDILDLSKIEAKKLSVNPEIFSVGILLDSLAALFGAPVMAKNLKFEIEASAEMRAVELYTDRQRLEQILRNFLSNAIKFTDEGQIRLRATRTTAGLLRLDVEDSGVGIATDKLQKIFDAFEQADSSVSRKYGGTGLGLTISRELAQLLEGDITLHSVEGKGATFTIQIPTQLSEKEADVPAVKSPAENESTVRKPAIPKSVPNNLPTSLATTMPSSIPKSVPKSMLVVEDDDEFRKLVVEAAKSYGFSVVTASSAEEALKILTTLTPSAILLDIKLPGMDGMELLAHLRRMPELRHAPIHMMSSLDYEQSALRMGAAGYLGKPVKLENLRSALRRLESVLDKPLKRLLIVEDDQIQLASMLKLIKSDALEVQTVSTGREAFTALESIAFDCIILDLSLPDMTGFDLLGQLGSLQIALPPIVIYTAKDLTQNEERFLRKHSESIIIKGVRSPERLLDEVNLFLHRMENVSPSEKSPFASGAPDSRGGFEGKTVLLVDDDLRNVFALTSALEDKKFNVRIARNGVEALEQLGEWPDIAIVLMDLMMPKMDGLECIRRIRQMKQFALLPIVALTAKAMKGDHERCIQAGANDYLPKPIEMNSLMSILNVWLRKSSEPGGN